MGFLHIWSYMWVYPWGKSRNFCCFITLKNRVYPATFAPRRLESNSTFTAWKRLPQAPAKCETKAVHGRVGCTTGGGWVLCLALQYLGHIQPGDYPKEWTQPTPRPPTVKNRWPSRNHKGTRAKGPAWAWTYKTFIIIIYIYAHIYVCVWMHVCMWCNVM